jgi:hypothetical protein
MPQKIKKTRKGSMLTLQEPSFVSLVGQPANRAGFKVFRGDSAEALRASLDTQLEKVLRRKDVNPDFTVFSIMLPEDITARSEAELIQQTFGFESDFTLTEDEGRYVLVANNAPQGDESIAVELGDGFEARLVRSDKKEETEMAGISLVALRFDADKFINPEAIRSWLAENEIDCKITPVDYDKYLEVQVSEVTRSDDGELGYAAVEEGVVAVVTPSEKFDLPGKTTVVRNYVYGNYGWGATSFDVAMADQTFTPWLENSISTLRYVLEEVAFYAPPEQRDPETLVTNISRVCLQFATAVSNMAATLPRSEQKSDATGETQVKNEDETMPKAEGQKPEEETATAATATGTTETRSDEQTAAGAAEGEGAGTTEEEVTTTPEAAQEAPSEAPTEVVATSDSKAGSEDKLAEMFGTLSASLKDLTETVQSLRDDQKTFKADMEKVKQSVEDLGESTIVRGDMGDPAPTHRSDDGNKSADPFAGVIFRQS